MAVDAVGIQGLHLLVQRALAGGGRGRVARARGRLKDRPAGVDPTEWEDIWLPLGALQARIGAADGAAGSTGGLAVLTCGT